ncbi:ROK family protein [Streptococcus merionis]|uniref:ROK family protein n=1 Tax=Streptococcus merionis TaxID=400065 RepID=UPI003514DAC7
MTKNCLCIDVGGGSIKYAVITERKDLKYHNSVKTPYEGLETYLELLVSIYEPFVEEVDGISLAVPGIIDPIDGICLSGGNLTYADGVHLVDELEERCQTKVKIINDAKAAALAEVGWGNLNRVKDAIVLVLGTAVGGALIVDGKIHNGYHFSAGEFSYMICGDSVDSPDNLWWGINGNERLRRRVAQAKGLDKNYITGEQIFELLESGDKQIEHILNDFTAHLAKMVMNLQFMFDPEKIAIGGGISRQPKLFEYIQKQLDYLYAIYPYRVSPAKVVNCKFFNEANLIGAYLNFYS